MAGGISNISRFFGNKAVAITGGTGFIGKCIVEKLLRDCPGIKNILLLVRPSKGETSEERFIKYFNSPAFGRLQERPDTFKKVELLSGDITLEGCGLSSAHKELLRSTDILIHSAASIAFHMPLGKFVRVNPGGLKNVADLALTMENIQSFVHISTAYCMPGEMLIEEKVYPTNIEPLQAIETFQVLPPDWLKQITPKITGKRNTYQYSKHLSERLLESYQDRLPISIVRPGTVFGSLKEPFPGWNEKASDTSICCKHTFTGDYPAIMQDPNVHFPMTPLDTLVNTVLAAAWKQTLTPPNPELKVYNCVPTHTNRITCGEMNHWGAAWVRRHPYSNLNFYFQAKLTKYQNLYFLKMCLFRFLPAYIYDLIVKPAKSELSWLRQFQKLHILMVTFSPVFMEERWYSSENMKLLNSAMSAEDKELFPLDFDEISWKEFSETLAMGFGKFSDSPGVAKPEKIMRLKLMHWAAKAMILSPLPLSLLALYIHGL